MIYLLTIICQQKLHYVSKGELDDVVLWLKMNIPSLHIGILVYETSGHYNQLHYHAVVDVCKDFYYKPFTKWGDIDYNYNTFKVQWSLVYNYGGACAYTQKDLYLQSQKQILIKNYYKHHFFNQDTQRFSAIAKASTPAIKTC